TSTAALNTTPRRKILPQKWAIKERDIQKRHKIHKLRVSEGRNFVTLQTGGTNQPSFGSLSYKYKVTTGNADFSNGVCARYGTWNASSTPRQAARHRARGR